MSHRKPGPRRIPYIQYSARVLTKFRCYDTHVKVEHLHTYFAHYGAVVWSWNVKYGCQLQPEGVVWHAGFVFCSQRYQHPVTSHLLSTVTTRRMGEGPVALGPLELVGKSVVDTALYPPAHSSVLHSTPGFPASSYEAIAPLMMKLARTTFQASHCHRRGFDQYFFIGSRTSWLILSTLHCAASREGDILR